MFPPQHPYRQQMWTETCTTLINQIFEINFQKALGPFRTCLPFVDFLPTTVPPSNVVWPSGHANSKSTECDSMCSQILQCDFLTPPSPECLETGLLKTRSSSACHVGPLPLKRLINFASIIGFTHLNTFELI